MVCKWPGNTDAKLRQYGHEKVGLEENIIYNLEYKTLGNTQTKQ